MLEPIEEKYLNRTVIEYRIITLNDQALKPLGEDGWEMCGITGDKMYFKKKVIKKVPRKLTQHESLFEEFWEKYPKKVGKIKVEQKFMNLSVHEATMAIAGLKEYLKVWHKDIKLKNTKFIPNPETWLNGKRWTDEIEIPKEVMSDIRAGEMRISKEKEEQQEEEKRRQSLIQRTRIDKKIKELEETEPDTIQKLRDNIIENERTKYPNTNTGLLQKQCEIILRTKINNLYFKK